MGIIILVSFLFWVAFELCLKALFVQWSAPDYLRIGNPIYGILKPFTPDSYLPAGSIYLLVITSPERKARVGRLFLSLPCTLSHYPSCSWWLGKLRLQWLVSMCGFQYGTTPKYLHLPYSPLKGGSSRPTLLLERYVTYTSGSSRIRTLSRAERFWVEDWQDENCIWRGLREGLQKRKKWKTQRPVAGQLALHAASFPGGHLPC